jgi:hypothetical protein
MSNSFALSASAHGLKESGNEHFAEFTTRHMFMSHERKTSVLNRARQCYETVAQMCRDALGTKAKDGGGGGGGHESPVAKVVVLQWTQIVKLMRAAMKNSGVVYRHLAEVELRSVTKIHCYKKAAEV